MYKIIIFTFFCSSFEVCFSQKVITEPKAVSQLKAESAVKSINSPSTSSSQSSTTPESTVFVEMSSSNANSTATINSATPEFTKEEKIAQCEQAISSIESKIFYLEGSPQENEVEILQKKDILQEYQNQLKELLK